jgi:Bacterial transcriptional regulator
VCTSVDGCPPSPIGSATWSLLRPHGYATSESESLNEVSTVAVPILKMRGLAVAALSVMGPTDRICAEIPHLAQLLHTESRTIRRQLRVRSHLSLDERSGEGVSSVTDLLLTRSPRATS